jgi:hypothetical protein
MKKILLPAFFAAFTLVSAATNAQVLPPGWPFPEKNDTKTKEERRREKDDRVVRDRDGNVIRDRDGNVILKDDRTYRNDGNLPPGQAKKKYGSKSAKVYAPGQRKKTERDRRDTDIFGSTTGGGIFGGGRDGDDDDNDKKQKKQKKHKNKGRK